MPPIKLTSSLFAPTISPPPKALTIAGSDSGGGAGIQADLKTFTAFRVYGASVITAVTSQNTMTVDAVHPVPDEIVAQQLRSVLGDIGADAIKTGMLHSSSIITTVVVTLRSYPSSLKNVVVDPVMVSTTGSELLSHTAVRTMIDELLPIAAVLTPNIQEAELLLRERHGKADPIQSLEDMRLAARLLADMGPRSVLLKGGHLPLGKESGRLIDGEEEERVVVDIFFENGDWLEIRNPYVRTDNTHGTGCTLSAAIAAGMANGLDAKQAVVSAVEYVHGAIVSAFTGIGRGHGPLNHYYHITPPPFAQNDLTKHLISSLPAGLWDSYIRHQFVRQLAAGTLPRECFLHYVKQDYLFLQHYARANALASYKGKTMEEVVRAAKIVLHIGEESRHHLKYCEKWGITKEEVLTTHESVYNVAYTRYVLDKGATGDALDLQVAMAPCLIGYGEIGLELYHDAATVRENNPYWEWIETYAGEAFQTAVSVGKEQLEDLGTRYVSTQGRLRELEKVFEEATRLEVMFWDMGMSMS